MTTQQFEKDPRFDSYGHNHVQRRTPEETAMRDLNNGFHVVSDEPQEGESNIMEMGHSIIDTDENHVVSKPVIPPVISGRREIPRHEIAAETETEEACDKNTINASMQADNNTEPNTAEPVTTPAPDRPKSKVKVPTIVKVLGIFIGGATTGFLAGKYVYDANWKIGSKHS